MLPRTRRAPKACHWCHKRKVRCDASIRGCPCTRCREDGRPECTLRGKLPRYLNGLETQNGKHYADPIISLIPDRRASESTTDPLPRGHVAYTTYPFLEVRRAASLPREDLTYMASTGCLSVPDKTVIDEFVRMYFLYLHPAMPVLDEAVFWENYLYPDKEDLNDSRLSLFVFQAVLFLSCTYVSLDTIQQCGFSDKRTARNAFYRRAKILFDLNGEDRPFIRAQGSVLLTNHASAQEPQAGSLWLTHAIQNAMISGCKPGPCEDVGETLKKRLWWSIILRDRSLCLGLRRRSQVTSVEFGMAAEPLNEGDFADEIYRSQVYDADTKRLLVNVLQEQCRLSVLLTEMVSFVFASHGLHAPLFTSEQFHKELARIACIQWQLQQWEVGSHLPLEPHPAEAVTMLMNLAYMIYYTAHIDLAHYEALLIENHRMFAGDNYRKHIRRIGTTLQHSVNQLTGVMEYFCRMEGSVQDLPLSVLANVAMPLVLTAIDMKLSPSSTEMTRRRRLLNTMGEIVRRSGRVYDVTDFVSTGTNHILQLAYMTSQNLFQHWDMDLSIQRGASSDSISNSLSSSTGSPTTSTGGEISSARRGGRGVGSGSSSSSSSNPVEQKALQRPPGTTAASRANTWHEAFLQHPRGYLLISTSVDYSLSVGRLPYDCALPEPVRCIPPISVGIRLPWAIPTPSMAMGRHRRQRQKQISDRNQRRVGETTTPMTTTPVTTTQVATAPTDNSRDSCMHDAEAVQGRPNDSTSMFKQMDSSTPHGDTDTANSEESRGRIQAYQQANHNPINLDYFCLDDLLQQSISS